MRTHPFVTFLSGLAMIFSFFFFFYMWDNPQKYMAILLPLSFVGMGGIILYLIITYIK